jgi:sigma-B regulation protein RsbU (phosphoserine phosphatase)
MVLTMTTELQNKSVSVQPRVLIADDQPDLLEALRLLLKSNGYTTEAVTSPAAILGAVAKSEFDVILMDLNYARDTTSGAEGLDLLSRLCGGENTPPIVVMTGWATVGLAVQAMQRGVGDFVEKPWVNAKLLEILNAQIQKGRESREEKTRSAENAKAQDKINSQHKQRESEVEEAQEIQRRFLPHETPSLRGYQISSTWQPARGVGGDYYDFLPLTPATLGICIADVAGKGMPAALVMGNLQAAFRSIATAESAPETVCDKLNARMCDTLGADRFVTFFYAQLDGESRKLRFVNAGHNAPILLRRDGSHMRLDSDGGVLGIFPEARYSSGDADLKAGDRVVFFTDGVTEAADGAAEEFGDKRLLETLQAHQNLDAESIQKKILESVNEFCAGTWQDDATLIVVAVD